MNRQTYISYIFNKLSGLSSEIELNASNGFFDIHKHHENFYRDFLDLMFDWNLQNAGTRVRPL